MRNQAFDVTPHKYITAIITDRGVFTPPFDKSLKHESTIVRNNSNARKDASDSEHTQRLA